MSFYCQYPPSVSSSPSTGTNGSPIPGFSTLVAGENPSGDLQPLQTDVSGSLLVSLAASLLNPLPTQDAADGTTGTAAPALALQVAGQNPTGDLTPINLDASGNVRVKIFNAPFSPIFSRDSADGLPNTATLPPYAIQIAGSDGTSIQAISVDTTGKVNINDISGTISLPTGAATAADQATGNASLASIDSKLTSPLAVTGPLTDTQLRASAVPVSLAASPLPTGAATAANQVTEIASLASIDSKLTSPLTVTGPLTDTQLRASAVAVSGPLTDTQLRASAVAVSAASLPLPTGAATETTLSAINTKTPSLGAALTAASTPVNIASDQVVPVSMASSPLPTGAATAANQTNGSQKSQIVDGSGNVIGSTLITGSQRLNVNLASGATPGSAVPAYTNIVGGKDGSGNAQQLSVDTSGRANVNVNGTVAITTGGKSKVNLVRNDYSSVNVTTAAYVQLIASTASTSNMLEIFDSSGQTLVLALGAAASEVDQFYINPGGNGQVPFLIPAGSRVSIKAITATANSGYINLNLYS